MQIPNQNENVAQFYKLCSGQLILFQEYFSIVKHLSMLLGYFLPNPFISPFSNVKKTYS